MNREKEATADARRHRRFVPIECDLAAKKDGWVGRLMPNVSRGILDLSEGGLSALSLRLFEEGERIRGEIVLGPFRERFAFRAEARHGRSSGAVEGCYVVGFRFVDLSPVLRVCIQSLLHRRLTRKAREGAPGR